MDRILNTAPAVANVPLQLAAGFFCPSRVPNRFMRNLKAKGVSKRKQTMPNAIHRLYVTFYHLVFMVMVLRCIVLPLCTSARVVYMHLANGVFQPYHSAGWLTMVSNDFPQPLAQATSWVKETGWRGDFGLNSTRYTFQSGSSTQPNA